MADFSAVSWVLIGLVALFVGLSKTGLPGLGILGVALLALVVGGMPSTGLMLPMLITGDLIAVAYYRRHANWGHLVKLMPPAAVGIVIGYFVMGFMQRQHFERLLNPFIGGVILLLLGMNRWLRSGRTEDVRLPDTWLLAAGVGVAAGITTMMSNAAGPIIVLYFLAMRLDRWEFIGTGAWYFLVLNLFKVPFSLSLNLITFDSLKINLLLLPVIVVGAAVGVQVLRRIPQKSFLIVVEVLVLIAAANLLIPPGAWSALRSWLPGGA